VGAIVAAEATAGLLGKRSEAGALEAWGGSEALASGAAARGGGAAQPVSPGDAGGAPPTISAVITTAHG